MKKMLTILLAMTFATACNAEESEQVTELKKRCEELSKETGKDYLYGSGELKYFARLEPPSDSPVRRDHPDPYGTDFIMPDKKQVRITIHGMWKNPDAALGELELAPVPIEMQTGKSYQFCYRIIKRDSNEHFYIDHSETIQLKE